MDEECQKVLWELACENAETVNSPVRFGDKPIHKACIVKNAYYVRTLLKNGADVNGTGAFGHTPLFIAIEKDDLEIAKILLEHGADPLIKNDWGFTALFYAQSINPQSDITRLTEEHLGSKS